MSKHTFMAFSWLLAGLSALGCRRAEPVRQPLKELGTVSIPAGLDPYAPVEKPTYTLFPFDRTASSPLLMGSNRPVSEKLVVAVWRPDARADAHGAAVRAAQDRMEDPVQWKQDGAYTIGDGIHQVNNASSPAWIIARDFDEKNLTIAYMVWKKDGSAEQACRVIDDTFASFQPVITPAQYLASRQARAQQERHARQSKWETALSARGVHLPPDGKIVEKDGILYSLTTDASRGRLLVRLSFLGTLPHVPSHTSRLPAAPREIVNWPGLLWLTHKGTTWEQHTFDDDAFLPPDGLMARVGQRHAAADQVPYYAYTLDAVEEEQAPGPPNLEHFPQAAARLKTLLRSGELMR